MLGWLEEENRQWVEACGEALWVVQVGEGRGDVLIPRDSGTWVVLVLAIVMVRREQHG